MINLNIQFKNFTTLLLWQGSDTVFYRLSNFTCENLETVFGNPNDIILAVPYRL